MGRSKNLHNTTVYLEPRQLKALRELSKRTGVPFAVYVRRGIDAILQREESERDQDGRCGEAPSQR